MKLLKLNKINNIVQKYSSLILSSLLLLSKKEIGELLVFIISFNFFDLNILADLFIEINFISIFNFEVSKLIQLFIPWTVKKSRDFFFEKDLFTEQ